MQASDIAGVIGTASVTVTDENGTTTTAGDGLAGLLEQANGLEGAVSSFFTTTNATYGNVDMKALTFRVKLMI